MKVKSFWGLSFVAMGLLALAPAIGCASSDAGPPPEKLDTTSAAATCGGGTGTQPAQPADSVTAASLTPQGPQPGQALYWECWNYCTDDMKQPATVCAGMCAVMKTTGCCGLAALCPTMGILRNMCELTWDFACN